MPHNLIVTGPLVAAVVSASSVFGLAGAVKLAGLDQPALAVNDSALSFQTDICSGKGCTIVVKRSRGKQTETLNDPPDCKAAMIVPVALPSAGSAAYSSAAKKPSACLGPFISIVGEVISGQLHQKDQSRIAQGW